MTDLTYSAAKAQLEAAARALCVESGQNPDAEIVPELAIGESPPTDPPRLLWTNFVARAVQGMDRQGLMRPLEE